MAAIRGVARFLRFGAARFLRLGAAAGAARFLRLGAAAAYGDLRELTDRPARSCGEAEAALRGESAAFLTLRRRITSPTLRRTEVGSLRRNLCSASALILSASLQAATRRFSRRIMFRSVRR